MYSEKNLLVALISIMPGRSVFQWEVTGISTFSQEHITLIYIIEKNVWFSYNKSYNKLFAKKV
jgi:hypothetical protein